MADHSIKGKTVLIAGGAKNLGGLIARDLAVHGARAVAIHYNSASSKADADKTVAAIQAAGAKAVAFQADLTGAKAVEQLFAETLAELNGQRARPTPCTVCAEVFDAERDDGIFEQPARLEGFICRPCAEKISAWDYFQDRLRI